MLGAISGKPAVERIIHLSPAIGGVSDWDLDIKGPLTVPSTGYTLTWDSSFGFTAELWSGAGAAGGCTGASAPNRAGSGGDSSFDVMSCTGGEGGENSNAPGKLGAGGKLGGIATGGDINLNGNDGGDGGSSGTSGKGGTGAAAPNGGAARSGPTTTGGANGSNGNGPGGGGSGAASGVSIAPANRGGGGGRSGACAKKVYPAGVITTTPKSPIIGVGGAHTTTAVVYAGGDGAAAKLVIT